MASNSKHGQVLSPEFLLLAYCNGYFPMARHRHGPIEWHSPDPRAIIPLDGLRVSRSLRRTLRKKLFEVRIDTEFEAVMQGCADREETWISEEIIAAYTTLHKLGYAHSVETWQNDRLVGGLYGVAIGGAFFGESMFSRAPDASKVALVHLVQRLKERGFALLDTQFLTEHLRSMGAREISRARYLSLLADAIAIKTSFGTEERT
ncbi:MAG: leucyl/phenylalanyl-tRNA--protein transferase [Ignavibacteria bacterium]